MIKVFLHFNTVLGMLLTRTNSAVIKPPCCTCSNDNKINASYYDCKNNNTCTWTCVHPVPKCGPLFFNPSIKEGPPSVTSRYLTFHKEQDEELIIQCKILSNPEANVTWLFNGTSIKTEDYVEKSSDCGSVLTMRVRTSDDGWFTCLAQNAKGSGNKTFRVNVTRKPIVKPFVIGFHVDTENNMAYLGTTFNLSCQINYDQSKHSIPLGSFSRHGRKVRDETGRYENFPDADVNGPQVTSKLCLKNATMDFEGTWECYGYQSGIKGERKSLNLTLVRCPAGYFCPWYESKKHECPYGTYSDGSTNVTYQCTKCPGKYPANKPLQYTGPAKSSGECPKAPDNAIIYIAVAISFFTVVLVVVVYWWKWKRKKPMPLSTTSEAELVPSAVHDTHEAVNNKCRIETETNQFNSDIEVAIPVQYDVFISYNSKDVVFATDIQTWLESQNLKCCIHFRDFIPGNTIIDNISNAIYGSRVTLAVLSPNFIESEWCKGELQQALTRSMQDHRVIPILYKNCEIPLELLHRTYIDYENCYVKPHFWEQLRNAVKTTRSAVESTV